MFGAGTAWQEIPERLERNQLSVSLLVTLGKSIEEPVEQCTVVGFLSGIFSPDRDDF